MDLTGFADEVGAVGEVTITGATTRGGPVPGVRVVRAPTGIDWLRGDEMTVCCGAGTLVAELDEALAAVGQCVAIPPSGTVGGALAVGRSGLRRLGYGPIRDTLLQARYVSSAGDVVKAGGPTVKNVSGFDLCRLLVGSYGTLGFLGEVILRTRPRARHEQWYTTNSDPLDTFSRLYRPTSVLWDGTTTWVLLEGHPDDMATAASAAGLVEASGPPILPAGGRWSISAGGAEIAARDVRRRGRRRHRAPRRSSAGGEVSDAVCELNRRIKANFDPTGRLNPGVDVLAT